MASRIRRLKCGEEKPSCLRCTKSGWQCDGYGHINKSLSRPSSPPELALVPILPRKPSITPSPTPAIHTNLELDDTERRYFHSFVEDVSTKLPSHDAFFWRGLALQESHTNLSVRHAIVAIGALAKSSQKILSGIHRIGPAHCPHREFALQEYQKAIQGLQHSMPHLGQGDGVKSTLISCIVLAFFDNFIGNGGFALRHVRYGREVLCKSTCRPRSNPPNHERDYNKIASMFLRLDMESFCAVGSEPNRTFITLDSHIPTFTFPTRLSNIEEALALRNLVVWEGYDLFYRTARYQSRPLEEIPVSIIQERDQFINHLRNLNDLLDLLVQNTLTDFNAHPLRRAEALKLPSTVLLIRLTTGLGAPESSCDNLLPEFAFLFDICRAALEYESIMDPAVNGIASSSTFLFIANDVVEGEIFSFDVRVSTALSLVATKCRSLPLRRHAINLLLSSHRREWMYDSVLIGKIGAWMLSLEEDARAAHSRKTSIDSTLNVLQSRKSSVDIAFGDWFGNSNSKGFDVDWTDDGFASLDRASRGDETAHIDDSNRVWGPVTEWDIDNGRRARIRCRQNFRTVDGNIAWIWKETDISW
jgi:hypothetical protein